MAYGAYLLEAFSPGVEKRLCGFFVSKTLVCNAFSTLGRMPLSRSFFLLIFFSFISVLLFNVVYFLCLSYFEIIAVIPVRPFALLISCFDLIEFLALFIVRNFPFLLAYS